MSKQEEKDNYPPSWFWQPGRTQFKGIQIDPKKHLEELRKNRGFLRGKMMTYELLVTGVLSNLKQEEEQVPIRILDLGCGLGSDCIEMAKLFGQTMDGKRKVQVVGVDFNDQLLETAKNQLEKNKKELESLQVHVEIKKGNVEKLLELFPKNSFDGVRGDLILAHTDIEWVLKGTKEVLKSGGVFVSLELGYKTSTLYTTNEDCKQFFRIFQDQSEKIYKNPGIGSKLSIWMESMGGWKDIYLDANAIVSNSMQEADEGWKKTKFTLEKLIEDKVVSREDADRYFEAWKSEDEKHGMIYVSIQMINRATKE